MTRALRTAAYWAGALAAAFLAGCCAGLCIHTIRAEHGSRALADLPPAGRIPAPRRPASAHLRSVR